MTLTNFVPSAYERPFLDRTRELLNIRNFLTVVDSFFARHPVRPRACGAASSRATYLLYHYLLHLEKLRVEPLTATDVPRFRSGDMLSHWDVPHKVVASFLGRGVDFKSDVGRGVLFNVASTAHDDTVRILQCLERRGADVAGKFQDGLTLLHFAVSNGRASVPVVEFLLRRGCPLNAPDDVGNTPLHYAAMTGDLSPHLIQYLVRNGADVTAESFQGRTPLHYVLGTEIAYVHLKHKAPQRRQFCEFHVLPVPPVPRARVTRCDVMVKVIRFLLDSGADWNLRDKDGSRPLELAVFNTKISLEIVEPLISHAYYSKQTDLFSMGNWAGRMSSERLLECSKFYLKYCMLHGDSALAYKTFPDLPKFSNSKLKEYLSVCEDEVRSMFRVPQDPCASLYRFVVDKRPVTEVSEAVAKNVYLSREYSVYQSIISGRVSKALLVEKWLGCIRERNHHSSLQDLKNDDLLIISQFLSKVDLAALILATGCSFHANQARNTSKRKKIAQQRASNSKRGGNNKCCCCRGSK